MLVQPYGHAVHDVWIVSNACVYQVPGDGSG